LATAYTCGAAVGPVRGAWAEPEGRRGRQEAAAPREQPEGSCGGVDHEESSSAGVGSGGPRWGGRAMRTSADVAERAAPGGRSSGGARRPEGRRARGRARARSCRHCASAVAARLEEPKWRMRMKHGHDWSRNREELSDGKRQDLEAVAVGVVSPAKGDVGLGGMARGDDWSRHAWV